MKCRGITVAQQPVEFEHWKVEVASILSSTYLEIGSFYGGSLLAIAPALSQGATIISVDIVERPELTASLALLKADGFDVRFLKGDCHKPEMEKRIAEALDSRKLDAAFIDGDHHFKSCLADYRLCTRLVRPGGLIGFHDLGSHRGVRRVFDNINRWSPGKTREYISRHPIGGGWGIGVVEQ